LRATASISLPQLGFHWDPYLAIELMHSIVTYAVRKSSFVWLDVHPLVDAQSNLETVIRMNRIPGFGGHMGITLQANLFRTQSDIECAIEQGIPVRLRLQAPISNQRAALQGALRSGKPILAQPRHCWHPASSAHLPLLTGC
jgi:hypothetical protein